MNEKASAPRPWEAATRMVRRRGQEHFGRGGMRILVQEVMLDLPGMVEAQPVGEDDLVERLVKQPRLVARPPGLGQLMLVEHPELHAWLRLLGFTGAVVPRGSAAL